MANIDMFMSPTQSISLFLGASAAVLSSLSAQTSVSTDPVGAMTLEFKDNSDTAFSVPLHRAAEFAGVVATDGVDGFTLTADGTPSWTADEFTDSPHYVLMMDGPMEGMYYTVLGNTSSELTVEDLGTGDLVAQGIAADQSFQVIPYWTLNTLFPDGEGFPASSDVFNPVGLVYFPNVSSAGVNIPLGASYFYHDGTQGAAGWYKAGALGEGLQNNEILSQDNFFVMRNLSGDDFELVLTGSVQMANFRTMLSRIQTGLAQDNFVGFTVPVPVSLADSGLVESGAFSESSDVFNPTDLLFAYDNSSVGLNKPLSSSYFYHDGSQGPEGWYQAGNLGVGLQDDSEVFQPGTGYVIRKSVGDAGVSFWETEPSYLSEN